MYFIVVVGLTGGKLKKKRYLLSAILLSFFSLFLLLFGVKFVYICWVDVFHIYIMDGNRFTICIACISAHTQHRYVETMSGFVVRRIYVRRPINSYAGKIKYIYMSAARDTHIYKSDPNKYMSGSM